MIFKGIDRKDHSFRHFTFDEDDYSIQNGEYYYKVNYGKNPLEEEYGEDEIGFVRASDVMTIGAKKPKPLGNPTPTAKRPEPVRVTPTPEPMVEKPKRGRPPKIKPLTMEPEATTVPLTTEWNGAYEYHVISFEFDSPVTLQETLNDIGKDGWEMCGFDTTKNLFGTLNMVAIFKRKRG